jgi:hypothetical protein
MAGQIQVRINNPCSERWEQMTEEGQGRFCAACQKTVNDFTGMSDAEIVRILSTGPNGGTCGRFLPNQLNRALLPESARSARRLGWWQYLLAGLLLSTEVSAQPKARADTVHIRLVDNSNNPVSFATIMIQPRHGYQADADGRVTIPRPALRDFDSLTISGIGYATTRVSTSSLTDSEEKIIMVPVNTTLGEVVVVGKVITHRRIPKKIAAVLRDTLACVGLVKNSLNVYPNPVTHGASVTLSLRVDDRGTYTAQLFSLSGVLKESMEINVDQKSSEVLMDIPSTLTAGAYFVRLSNSSTQKVYTKELLVL